MSFTLKGTSSMRTKLLGQKLSIHRDAVQALNFEGERIITDSKQNYVPRDEGTLRNTGHVQHAKHGVGDIKVTLRFGPIVTAIVIHEVPDYNPRSWGSGTPNFTHGGPKYLEKPLYLAVPGMPARIAQIVKL